MVEGLLLTHNGIVWDWTYYWIKTVFVILDDYKIVYFIRLTREFYILSSIFTEGQRTN